MDWEILLFGRKHGEPEPEARLARTCPTVTSDPQVTPSWCTISESESTTICPRVRPPAAGGRQVSSLSDLVTSGKPEAMTSGFVVTGRSG